MADGFGYYGGFYGVPYWLSSPSTHPSVSAPPFLSTHPVESYDQTQGGFDPMNSHGSYHRSPADWSNNPSYGENSRSLTPSSFYADNSRPGNFGPRGEDLFSPGGFYPSRGTSSDVVPLPLPTENKSERQRLDWVPYNSTTSATVSSLADMLIRNSQEPFYMPSGFYASSNASVNAVSGPPVEPCIDVPSFPMSSLKTEALFDGTHTGVRLGGVRSVRDVVSSHPPENVQSSLQGSSVEPVNFDLLSTGHVKPLSKNPDLRNGTVGSTGTPRSSHQLQFDATSSGSLFKEKREGSGSQRPNTLVADSENGISESSLKNAIGDLNCAEHKSWNNLMVSSEGNSAPTLFSMESESCGAIKSDNGNVAQSTVNYKSPSEGSANQPSEDVESSQKTCKLQEQMFNMMNRDKKTTLLTDLGNKGSSRSNENDVSTGQESPERNLCDQGDFPSPGSSPRVSSVVNAMHNLSEVLVYECFNNGSWLKPEQLENLDKVVDNLTKCLKKITGNKTTAEEASVPSQAMHVSCPNVVDLNEVGNVVVKDCQGFSVKAPNSFKEPVDKDKNEMTQSIKNILASNFLDGEENHPQTLLYKSLWLETEAALCSTTFMARYDRIKNEIGNLKLQNREISADASTFMQEPVLNPQKSDSIMNTETIESLIKDGSNCGNNVVTMSHDAPQSSIFNSDPVDTVLSLMSRSFTGGLEQENHGSLKPDAQIPDTIQHKSHASTTEEKHNDVTEGFQLFKQLETNRKLKSQNCSETRMDEDIPEAWKVADIGRSSRVSDVMDRFQILKRREAERGQKTLNSLDIDSDSDSDSDNDQPRNKAQMCDHLLSASMMKIRGNSQIADTEASSSGKGYESLTADWEHVLKDD